MEFAGLPFHFIVLHAAVVLGPLTALFAFAFALLPRWRYLLRLPTAALTLVTFVSVWLSRLSGSSYLSTRPELADLVRTHQDRGELLSLLTTLFAVVAAVSLWGLGGPSGFRSDYGAREGRSAVLDRVLPLALGLTAALMLVWVVLTGDAGARATWG